MAVEELEYVIPPNIPIRKGPDGEEFVKLRSAVGGRTIILEPDDEQRDWNSGNFVVRRRGARVKFNAGYANCPLKFLGQIQNNPQWNVSIFFAEDARATTEKAPTQSGMATTSRAPGSPQKPSLVVPDGWDDKGVSDLISEIKLGTYDSQLTDLVGHEVGKRNRSQIVVSLSKRIRDLSEED